MQRPAAAMTRPAAKAWLETALASLAAATSEAEAAMAVRDDEIAQTQARYGPAITRAMAQREKLTAEIEEHWNKYGIRLKPPGAKSLQLTHGTVGYRRPPVPALVPVSWSSWEKAARAIRKLWGPTKYFKAPKVPALDKNALKTLPAADLAKVGLVYDEAETFFIDLNRLPTPQLSESGAAA